MPSYCPCRQPTIWRCCKGTGISGSATPSLDVVRMLRGTRGSVYQRFSTFLSLCIQQLFPCVGSKRVKGDSTYSTVILHCKRGAGTTVSSQCSTNFLPVVGLLGRGCGLSTARVLEQKRHQNTRWSHAAATADLEPPKGFMLELGLGFFVTVRLVGVKPGAGLVWGDVQG